MTRPAPGAPVQHSVSTSRQFIVFGADLAVRGAICDFAERTKGELLAVLQRRDDWITPIVINAQFPQANLPELPRLNVDVGQTGYGLKFQIDVVVNPEAERPELRREVLRALLLERIYRGQPNLRAGAAYTSPPDWLLDGIPEPESDPDRMRSVLALVASAKKILPLEKFLAQRPELLDAAGRTLYRAYSLALVDLLHRSPNGPRRVEDFIAALSSSSNDASAEMRRHFPQLFEGDAGAAVWEKQIVRFSSARPFKLAGAAETERRLENELRITVSEGGIGKHYRLEEFARFLRAGSANSVLAALARDLRALTTRANPIYTRLVAEYADIATRLSLGKTARVARRLDELRAARSALRVQMRQIDDYLNWFQATALTCRSEEFADYMGAADRASRRERTKRDPISVYLNALEIQFEN